MISPRGRCLFKLHPYSLSERSRWKVVDKIVFFNGAIQGELLNQFRNNVCDRDITDDKKSDGQITHRRSTVILAKLCIRGRFYQLRDCDIYVTEDERTRTEDDCPALPLAQDNPALHRDRTGCYP